MTLGIAIVGHGKMGQLIEKLAPEYGCEVRARFTSASSARNEALSRTTLEGVDVGMDPGGLGTHGAGTLEVPLEHRCPVQGAEGPEQRLLARRSQSG